jgi:hypothetical protein
MVNPGNRRTPVTTLILRFPAGERKRNSALARGATLA